MHMAATTKVWTLEELHSLPDDGNKYELVHGELFVTPPPTDDHETISAVLTRLLDPYVAANGLGLVYHPRAVMRLHRSEVEPDLMVRQRQGTHGAPWDGAPLPILVVEILSNSTRRRDLMQKRDFYMEVGVPEYWTVDPERAEIRVVRPRQPDVVTRDELVWAPAGARSPLTIRVADVFAAR